MHLSAVEAIPALRSARASGVDISVETCPHYLTFASELIADGATELKCCPPIRQAANRDALWEALSVGDVDFVVSDHSPCTPELKELGEATSGPPGVASPRSSSVCQPCGPAREPRAQPDDVVRWMATSPADRVGFELQGPSPGGRSADLVRFAPDDEFTVDAATLHHRNPVSAYHGHRLAAWSARPGCAAPPSTPTTGPPRTPSAKRTAMSTMHYYVPRGGLHRRLHLRRTAHDSLRPTP